MAAGSQKDRSEDLQRIIDKTLSCIVANRQLIVSVQTNYSRDNVLEASETRSNALAELESATSAFDVYPFASRLRISLDRFIKAAEDFRSEVLNDFGVKPHAPKTNVAVTTTTKTASNGKGLCVRQAKSIVTTHIHSTQQEMKYVPSQRKGSDANAECAAADEKTADRLTKLSAPDAKTTQAQIKTKDPGRAIAERLISTMRNVDPLFEELEQLRRIIRRKVDRLKHPDCVSDGQTIKYKGHEETTTSVGTSHAIAEKRQNSPGLIADENTADRPTVGLKENCGFADAQPETEDAELIAAVSNKLFCRDPSPFDEALGRQTCAENDGDEGRSVVSMIPDLIRDMTDRPLRYKREELIAKLWKHNHILGEVSVTFDLDLEDLYLGPKQPSAIIATSRLRGGKRTEYFKAEIRPKHIGNGKRKNPPDDVTDILGPMKEDEHGESTDQYGHILAVHLGGTSPPANFFVQNKTINMSWWPKNVDNKIVRFLKQESQSSVRYVDYRVRLLYNSKSPGRPYAIVVFWRSYIGQHLKSFNYILLRNEWPTTERSAVIP